MGILAVDRGDFPAGVHLIGDALTAGYRSALAYRYFGYATQHMGDVDRAIDAYRNGLELDPLEPVLANNLALALMVKARWKEAAEWARTALTLRPGFAEARFNLGRLDLQAGDFAAGWEGYDARWELPGCARPPIQHPLWDGSAHPGKHLLLYPDQGMGDSLMFARYIPAVANLGLQVHLLVQPELKEILQTVEGVASIRTYGEELPAFDLHTSLPSLPRLLNTRVDTIPWRGAYLHTPDRIDQREELDRLLRVGRGRKRVGVIWQGNPNFGDDTPRALPPELLQPLGRIPDLILYSLQFGGTGPLPIEGMVDLGPHLQGFANTAHALDQLDVLVSVDTAVAHLAGAMGKEVLLLLHQNSDWRWLLGREDSPWYPGHRLLRQAKYSDWSEPLKRVGQILSR